jgi:hypothetical protein
MAKRQMHTEFSKRKLNDRDFLENISVDGILKRTSKARARDSVSSIHVARETGVLLQLVTTIFDI